MSATNGFTATVNGDQTIGTSGINCFVPATGGTPLPATAMPLVSDPTDTIPAGKGLLLIQIGSTYWTQLQVYVE